MSGVFNDLKHGARMLLKNPGFTLVAVLSIAIGVGANAAMFSVADGLVLRPLQVPRPNEVLGINATAPRAGDTFVTTRLMSHPDYVDLRERTRSFTGVLAYSVVINSFANRPNEPAQTKLGFAVSGNFFDVLELRPALGRLFLPDEDRVPGRDAVVVLSYSTWTDQFGADRTVMGRQIRLGGLDFTVIGVAPADFSGMRLALPPAYYIPLAMTVALPGYQPDLLEQRNARFLDVRARLKAGVSLEQARAETTLIARALEQEHSDTNRNYGLLVRTAFEARLDERGPSAPGAFMLLAVALVVLLVACANVAGLLISRGPVRQREIALRMAIGGGRGRVIRQLITESLLLAAGGAVLGLAMASGVMVLLQLPVVSDIGVRLTFDLDRRAILAGLVVATASALLSSVVPAWRATHRTDMSATLRQGVDFTGRSRVWGRNGLVAMQVALALIVLTVTVSLFRAFQIEVSQPGFRTERMLLSTFDPQLARYDDGQADAFYARLKERVRALPGVQSVGMTSVMPLNQDNRQPTAIVPEGFQMPRGIESMTVLSSRIDDGYLGTLGVPILRGRGVEAADTAETRRVVLINQAMATRYWPGQDPIGKRVRFVNRDSQPWAEIVGVTADNKFNWIGEPPTPWLYIPQLQDSGYRRSTLVVASAGASASLGAAIREVVRDLDPNMPLSGLRTIEEFYYGNAIGIVLVLVRVVGAMGVLGLALAMIGLYGLVAYAVARRTREIGIRMAVGAKPSVVLRDVLRHGFLLAGSGMVLGAAGCIAAGALLRSAFPNTGGIDLTTYVLVVPVLVAVTLVASYIPAHRAARIDPLRALRTE
jgi:putative ABC transport system permease protein